MRQTYEAKKYPRRIKLIFETKHLWKAKQSDSDLAVVPQSSAKVRNDWGEESPSDRELPSELPHHMHQTPSGNAAEWRVRKAAEGYKARMFTSSCTTVVVIS